MFSVLDPPGEPVSGTPSILLERLQVLHFTENGHEYCYLGMGRYWYRYRHYFTVLVSATKYC